MQTDLLWKGREFRSLEACLVTTSETGSAIHSSVVGAYHDLIYAVEYTIITDHNWTTTHLEVCSRVASRFEKIVLDSDGKGSWKMNGENAVEFIGCLDIDISLTPFTNTLPIKRLDPAVNAEANVKVIFLDILEFKTIPVRQKYTRLSETRFRYENVPNDFEAIITVDEDGFVVDYPALFERLAKSTC